MKRVRRRQRNSRAHEAKSQLLGLQVDVTEEAFDFETMTEEAAELSIEERLARDKFGKIMERRRFGTRFHSDEHDDDFYEHDWYTRWPFYIDINYVKNRQL